MVQINSIYVDDGMTVVTLFVSDDHRMTYAVDDIFRGSYRTAVLSADLLPELQREIELKSAKVWGSNPNLYILKPFNPWSKELGGFILQCWQEIRRTEKSLFNK